MNHHKGNGARRQKNRGEGGGDRSEKKREGKPVGRATSMAWAKRKDRFAAGEKQKQENWFLLIWERGRSGEKGRGDESLTKNESRWRKKSCSSPSPESTFLC